MYNTSLLPYGYLEFCVILINNWLLHSSFMFLYNVYDFIMMRYLQLELNIYYEMNLSLMSDPWLNNFSPCALKISKSVRKC